MFNREEGGGLVKEHLSYISYESRRNVKKVEKVLKYKIRGCKGDAMDIISEILKIHQDGILAILAC